MYKNYWNENTDEVKSMRDWLYLLGEDEIMCLLLDEKLILVEYDNGEWVDV